MKGFTLIETVLYIALLGTLLTSGITTSYQLLRSASTDSSQLESYDEAVFVLQKVQWVLSQTPNTTEILAPIANTHSSVLSIISQNGLYITVCTAQGQLRLYEGAHTAPACDDAAFVPLTHTQTKVSNFDAYQSQQQVRISITLNATTYTTTTYVP
jgi:competence protein ComGF